jgi:hypothetical protein
MPYIGSYRVLAHISVGFSTQRYALLPQYQRRCLHASEQVMALRLRASKITPHSGQRRSQTTIRPGLTRLPLGAFLALFILTPHGRSVR